SLPHSKSGQSSLVFSRAAGDAALLSADGRRSAGSRTGGDGANCHSLFQSQYRSRGTLSQGSPAPPSNLLRSRDSPLIISIVFQGIRRPHPNLDYGRSDAPGGAEFSAIVLGIPSLFGGSTPVLLGDDVVL